MHLKTPPLVMEVTQSERFYGLAWGPPLLPFDPPNWGGGDMGMGGGNAMSEHGAVLGAVLGGLKGGMPGSSSSNAGGGGTKAPSIDGEHGWFVVRTEHTDAEGWLYGTAFDHLEVRALPPRTEGWPVYRALLWRPLQDTLPTLSVQSALQLSRPGGRASKRGSDQVRSRVWRRIQGLDQVGEAGMVRRCEDPGADQGEGGEEGRCVWRRIQGLDQVRRAGGPERRGEAGSTMGGGRMCMRFVGSGSPGFMPGSGLWR